MVQYLSRTGTAERTEDVICRVSQNSTGNPILFLPSKDTGGSLPEGPLKIEVDGRTMEADIARIAINVVRNPGEAGNQLSAILRFLFGDGAGTPEPHTRTDKVDADMRRLCGERRLGRGVQANAGYADLAAAPTGGVGTARGGLRQRAVSWC